MPFFAEPFAAAIICTCILALACGCGISVWLTGWRGKTAAVVLGVGIIISGFTVLYLTTRTIPRYWWVSLLPIYLGIQCIRIWNRSESTRGFRLSSLLLTIGMLGAVLGGVGQLYRQRLLENPIVAKIESLARTNVQYDFDGFASGVIFHFDAQDAINESLPQMIHLRHLRRVQIDQHDVSLDLAKQIGRLTQIRELGLQSTNFNDEKMSALSNLRKLETLDLMGNPVSAVGLKHLRGAKKLRRIWIDNDSIPQEDLDELQATMPKCDVH